MIHTARRSMLLLLPLLAVACTSAPESNGSTTAAAPPPNIQEWMDRLTVDHHYDPDTGFIVADETVTLPPLIAAAPAIDHAIRIAGDRQLVIAVATADRCAPCQQYKRDALNNPEVIAALSTGRFLPTHVEVDTQPALADAHLPSRAIPMTYALRQGEVVATLRGQRSAADVLEWLGTLR